MVVEAPQNVDAYVEQNIEQPELSNGWTNDAQYALSGAFVVVIPPRPEKQDVTADALVDYMQLCRNHPFTCV